MPCPPKNELTPHLYPSTLPRSESDGLNIMVHNAIRKSPDEIRTRLFGNIVLAGGTTLIPGLATRLYKELHSRYPTTAISIKVA